MLTEKEYEAAKLDQAAEDQSLADLDTALANSRRVVTRESALQTKLYAQREEVLEAGRERREAVSEYETAKQEEAKQAKIAEAEAAREEAERLAAEEARRTEPERLAIDRERLVAALASIDAKIAELPK